MPMGRRFRKINRTYSLLRRRRGVQIRQLKNHPFVIPVVTFLVLFFVSTIAFIGLSGRTVEPSDSHVVIVSYDRKKESVPTRATTVKEFLDRAGIELREGDVVEPDFETPIVEDNFRVNVYRGRSVLIEDDGRRIFTYSAAATPVSVASQAGLAVYPEDDIKVEVSDDLLRDATIGEKIVINRATATNLNLYGTPLVVRTRVKTVGDLLAEKQVSLAPDDTVQPAPDTPLAPNIQIFVTRHGVQITSVEEAIPAPTETVEDASLSFGATAVRQKGVPGKRVVTYQLVLQNGKEVGRQKIQEVIVQEPVKRIVARGQAVYIPADKSVLMRTAGIAESDFAYVNYIISRESGWCPTKWQGQVGYCPAFYEEKYSPTSLRGYGLCQSTPAIKMSTAGSDWATNPVTQLRWCSGYASGRHGGWAGAYNFWVNNRYW